MEAPKKDRSSSKRSRLAAVRGFTLIELLAALSIVSILAALAFQQYAQYRRKGFDARALADLRQAASAEEAYFATYLAYKSCSPASVCAITLPAIERFSDGTALALTATTTGFSGTASHPLGSGIVYTWSSYGGGLQ